MELVQPALAKHRDSRFGRNYITKSGSPGELALEDHRAQLMRYVNEYRGDGDYGNILLELNY